MQSDPARLRSGSRSLLLGYVYRRLSARRLAPGRACAPRAHRREPIEPVVTVVVVAHNEAERIDRADSRISSRSTIRPRPAGHHHRLGRIDRRRPSSARARTPIDRVAVRAFRRRRGKAAVLNDVVPHARGDIVVLADARQRFERGSGESARRQLRRSDGRRGQRRADAQRRNDRDRQRRRASTGDTRSSSGATRAARTRRSARPAPSTRSAASSSNRSRTTRFSTTC